MSWADADWRAEIERLEAENARLENAVIELTEENRLVGLQMDRLADENEKLCTALKHIQALDPAWVKYIAATIGDADE